MADKIKLVRREIGFLFYCPGCKNSHMVTTVHEKPCWDFNYDAERPTISPSYLVQIPASDDGKYPAVRCHSYIRDGRIEYLSDCTHDLRGQTVDLPDWKD